MEGARPLKVLLIATDAAATPAWNGPDGARFDVLREPSISAAAERLERESFDAILLDATLAQASDGAFERLCARRDGTALILLDRERLDGGAPAGTRIRPGADAVLPALLPPGEQARLLSDAVRRARAERELERATRALRRSEARFRDVIERNADAIVVVDRVGVVRFANALARELFGRPQHELIGSPFGFPLVAGETTELDLIRAHEPIVVEMRVVDSEWEGEAACIASLRDITGRRRAEENARRLVQEQAARRAAESSARRFRFLAESSTVLASSLNYGETLGTLVRLCVAEFVDWAAVYVLEERGQVRRLEIAHRDPALAATAQELRDQPIPPHARHPVFEVLKTRRPLVVRAVDERQLRSLAPDPVQFELIRTLGVASFMMVPLVAHGRGLGAIALVSADARRSFEPEDVRLAEDLALRAALALDNARLYREAQAANQAKLDFLAVVSHDLRTPLNSIIGHAQLLAMGLPDPLTDATLDRVERIHIAAKHQLYLIDQLLAFARLEAGHERLAFSDTTIREIIGDVTAVMEPLAHERGLRLHAELANPELSLRTDPDKLRQVLLNLVANAVKYTDRGEVRLEVRDGSDGSATIAVRDTGIGITAADLEHVFEPFWQVARTRKTDGGGTGLGLSVVKRLVELLGGDISVESMPGRGSVFTVSLPARPEPA